MYQLNSLGTDISEEELVQNEAHKKQLKEALEEIEAQNKYLGLSQAVTEDLKKQLQLCEAKNKVLEYENEQLEQELEESKAKKVEIKKELDDVICDCNKCHFGLRTGSLPVPENRLIASTRPFPFHRSKCVMSRRGFGFRGVAAAGLSVMGSSLATEPAQGIERLPFKPEGYNFWTWRGHKIHYVVQGEGPAVLLIHGFGASSFHWWYNIPELSKRYKVYAIDLLGFGWSEKALVEYDAMIWRDQVVDFFKVIVKEPTVLVGNSLGGFTALVSAVALPEQVVGVALLNAAGQFGNANSEPEKPEEETVLQKFITKTLKEVFQRVVLGFFILASKAARSR